MYASDLAGAGLSTQAVDALRYDGQSDDPDEVAGILKSLMPGGSKVLDVGCGTGSVAVIANRDKHNQLIAIEPDPDRCAVARSRGIDAHPGFLTPEFIDRHGPFDVVMSSDVLEHLVDPGEMLDLFRSALRPGGTLLVSVPNVAHWSVRASLLLGRFRYAPTGIMDATHLRWFTQDTLKALVESRGFIVEQVRMTAGLDLPVYTQTVLGRLPRRVRQKATRLGTRALPTLFGCQTVILARPN